MLMRFNKKSEKEVKHDKMDIEFSGHEIQAIWFSRKSNGMAGLD